MNNRLTTLLILVICLASTPMLHAEKPADAFAQSITPMLDRHRGDVSVATKHLKTGEQFTYHADRPMPTASLIKLPVMAAAYQAVADGKVDLDVIITLKQEDMVPGSGVLTTHFSPGAKLSLRDAIQLMIAFSDNTATNLVIDQIGLPATTALMKQLGCPNTQLNSKVYLRDTSLNLDRSKEFGLGSTTASEMLSLLELLHQGKLVSTGASAAMRDHLLACDDRSKIPRYLGADVPIAHKTGAVSACRCDAGIIESPAGPIAFCVLTGNNEDRSWGEENEAELLAAEFGRALYDHFNEPGKVTRPTVARVLKIGADGDLVEALQRTLNARLKPSPEIGVDGDFGPNTESAVMKFQKQAGVEATGLVDASTWRALGPLLTEDQPATDAPPTATARVKKAQPDRLDGPPIVTCRAYAIADGVTGELLWGYNNAQQRDPASVTKIMTAYLVTSLAEQDPSVLEDTLTFTETADNTSGSTSGVKAGERLSVKDALYGLLLPSGNDMAVALAEHFGARLSSEPQEGSSYDKFIQSMNAQAKKLGMADTGYRNPHGLTAAGHVTTASDMAKLAFAALKQPLFREIVATPQHGCQLESIDGYQRNVVWNNTNRLLGIEGFDGVKTGTTGPAGACLVSSGEREGKRLIVVILGASSSDSRYVDSRNLYRWAWLQLQGNG